MTIRILLITLLTWGVLDAKAQQNNAFTSSFKPTKNYDREEADDMLTGKMTISVGYGAPRISFGTIRYFFGADKLDFIESASGPYFFKIGYGLSKYLEIGLNVNLSSANATFKVGKNNEYLANVDYTSWSALGRVNIHFLSTENFSPYFGLSLGYRNFSFQYSDNSAVTPSLPFLPAGLISSEIGIGARYFFVPNVGLYTEIGLSRTIFQGGLTVRF